MFLSGRHTGTTGLVILLTCVVHVSAQPSVSLMNGTIVGKFVTYESTTVKAFLGIPFAKPPVGGLRFSKPVAEHHLGSKSPYDATYNRPCCPQMGVPAWSVDDEMAQDEDCLYLNVFAPTSAPDENEGHAVMIWIHGGAFKTGGGAHNNGEHLASRGNVIVVTFNYRLGIFGFLSTMDQHAHGNYGLYDQHCVIAWVHKYISAFGGDPSRVTVFGESAGAVSATLQGLYVKNYGHFHKMIAQGGSFLAPHMKVERDPKPAAMFAASASGCSTEDHWTMLDCLRQTPWRRLRDVINEYSDNPAYRNMLHFHPTIDFDIISMTPKQMMDKMKMMVPEEIVFFRSLTLITGVNAFAGGASMNKSKIGMDMMQTEVEPMAEHRKRMEYIKHMLKHLYGKAQSFPNATMELIYHEYTNWSHPHHKEHARTHFVKALGDAECVVPTIMAARLHSQDNVPGKTHVYQFEPASSHRPEHTPEWLPGANRGEEIQFIFGENYDKLQTWEKTLSDHMVKYWSNIAKSG